MSSDTGSHSGGGESSADDAQPPGARQSRAEEAVPVNEAPGASMTPKRGEESTGPKKAKGKKNANWPQETSSRSERATREEVQRKELEARITPFREQLQRAAPAEFLGTLESVMSKWKKGNPNRKQTQALLRDVLLLAPGSVSGARVVKFFRASSDWNPQEVVVAVEELARTIEARRSEADQLGPLLHGALLALLDGAMKQQGPASERRQSDDTVAALLRLHAAVWSCERAPLTGLPGMNQVNWLRDAAKWLGEMSEREDVRAIAGQRLFGFELVFELRQTEVARAPSHFTAGSRAEGTMPVVREVARGLEKPVPSVPSPHAEPKSASLGSSSGLAPAASNVRSVSQPVRPDTSTDKIAKEVLNLRRERDRFARLVEALEKTRDRLQRELRTAVDHAASVEESLAAQVRQLERAQAMIETLEEDVVRLAPLEAELADSREALRTEREALSRLREDLAAAERQVEEAKRSETARGRALERAAVIRQFKEPLQQIESAATACECPDAGFIRDMARALQNYLTGGE